MTLKTCKSLLLATLLGSALSQTALAGDKAPGFVLPTNSGNITLSEFKAALYALREGLASLYNGETWEG